MEKREAERNIEEIRRMLKETEEEVRQIAINGVDYQILWGFLVLIGLGLNFLFIKARLFIWIPIEWFLIMVLGWFFSSRLTKREFKRTGIITFVGKVEGIVWFATSIGIVLVILFGWISKFFDPVLIPAFIAILVGNAFFISSFLFSSRISSLISPLWWIGAIVMVINPGIALFLYIGLVMLTMIVPGLITKAKRKGR